MKRIIYFLTLIMSFGLGYFTLDYISAEKVNLESFRIRVRMNNLEWFDGTKWNVAASVDSLAEKDEINTAKVRLEDFEKTVMQISVEKSEHNKIVSGKETNELSSGKVPVVITKQENTVPTSGTSQQSAGGSNPQSRSEQAPAQPEWSGDYE